MQHINIKKQIHTTSNTGKHMIWNESIECMDRESLRKIQSIRLKKIVDYVYHNTPFYRKKMQEMGITPDDINTIDDIVKLARLPRNMI